jgi:hypothetical protein
MSKCERKVVRKFALETEKLMHSLYPMDRANKSTITSVRSAMVSRFYVRPTSKRWFLKIIQVTMKHDLFDAM